MNKGVVVYNSVSVLYRARKLLKKKQIATRVVQLPSDLGLSGCSYGMECAIGELEGILAYSAEKNLQIKAAFRLTESEDGRVYTAYDLS